MTLAITCVCKRFIKGDGTVCLCNHRLDEHYGARGSCEGVVIHEDITGGEYEFPTHEVNTCIQVKSLDGTEIPLRYSEGMFAGGQTYFRIEHWYVLYKCSEDEPDAWGYVTTGWQKKPY